MGFVIKRVNELPCPKCGATIDTSAGSIGQSITCAKCGVETQVPAQFDHFYVYEKLGKGGFGRVFRARDIRLERDVAIKVLVNEEGETDDDVALKLIKEARTLARLNHPNIVRIYELGEYEGQHYIVMELLNGGAADQWTGTEDPPSERRTLRLGISIADALRAAHKVGLVHMDVKPGNILFDKDGHARLIDFGTALVQSKAGKSKEGIVGTPYYIAPEVARGKTPDFRSDMYSLGASLFHVLTGRPPFEGKTAKEVIRKRFEAPAPPVIEFRPEVNNATAEVIDRMLEFKRSARFETYDDLIEALEKALSIAKQRKARPDESDYIADDVDDTPDDPLAALEQAATPGAVTTAPPPPRVGTPSRAAISAAPRAAATRPAGRYAATPRRARKRSAVPIVFAIVLLALIGIGVLLALRTGGSTPGINITPGSTGNTPGNTPGGGAAAPRFTGPAPKPIDIVSHGKDARLTDGGSPYNVTGGAAEYTRVGNGGPADNRQNTAFVYFFALPTLGGDMDRLAEADLRLDYTNKTGNPSFNAAVYAVGLQDSPSPDNVAYGHGRGATGLLIQDDYVTPETRLGEVRLAQDARATLGKFIRDQYRRDGKPTQPWLVIRVNPSAPPDNKHVAGYHFKFSEDIGQGYASPMLTLTFR